MAINVMRNFTENSDDDGDGEYDDVSGRITILDKTSAPRPGEDRVIISADYSAS